MHAMHLMKRMAQLLIAFLLCSVLAVSLSINRLSLVESFRNGHLAQLGTARHNACFRCADRTLVFWVSLAVAHIAAASSD